MSKQLLFDFALEIKAIKSSARNGHRSAAESIRRRTVAYLDPIVNSLRSDVAHLPSVVKSPTKVSRVTAKQHELNTIFSRLLRLSRNISENLDRGVNSNHTLEQTQAAIVDILGPHFCQETAQLYRVLRRNLSRNAHEMRDTLGCPPLEPVQPR